MRTFQEIRDNYRFSPEDLEQLRYLGTLLEPVAEEVVEDFYNFLQEMPDTARFLEDPERLARLKKNHHAWLLGLFQGPLDENYYRRLQRIGLAHVRIGLSAHFVYVAMNFLRSRLKAALSPRVEACRWPLGEAALDKILDLNLDVIARAYHQEEMRRFFLSYKFDDALIRFARRFTFGLNLLLLIGLIGLAGGMVLVLFNDLSLIVKGQFDKGLVAALGSLLILWLAIELLDAEVDRLQGGELQLSLFVGVGLVAFIRKILIATLSHESVQAELIYLGGILVFGLIYWLTVRAEARKR
uniref:Heme-binding sensor globin domain-containing protein n=1 Tax=Desulfobacca acetoxidans TaxID=60893 RepID=A0A7V4LD19_9BACT